MRTLGPGTWGQTWEAFLGEYAGDPDGVDAVWEWIGRDPILSDGWEIGKWIQQHCRHTEGPHAKKLIQLRNWQWAELVEIFRLDGDGNRVYRQGLLGVPRKNGKSMLGACLALHGLCGDDEYGAEVYGCAGTIAQGRVVYREAVSMTMLGKENGDALFGRLVIKESISEIHDPPTRSWYKVVSSEAYSSEGLKPSRVIFDEVHVQPDHKLWNVMTSGSATRTKAMILGITTAGFDKETLCGRMYDEGRAAERRGEPTEVYFRWFESPRKTNPLDPDSAERDWRDPDVWRLSNPMLDDALTVAAIRKAELPNGESSMRRYRLNQWTSNIAAWLPDGAWAELADLTRRLEPDEDIVISLDGSFNNDSTAVVACTRDQYIAVIGIWEKPDDDDDWRVNIDEVENAIRKAFEMYRVQELAYDPMRWERTAQVLSDELGADRVVKFPQTTERLTAATTDLYDAVVRDRSVSHDGNPTLARHVDNARIKTTARGSRIVKETQSSSNKIDAAVAAIMAHSRSRLLPEGRWNLW